MADDARMTDPRIFTGKIAFLPWQNRDEIGRGGALWH
jgi:hypothetical protein